MAEENQKSFEDLYKDLIVKHKIVMEAPPCSEILPSNKFIVIRHGFSEHNFVEKETLYKNPLKGKDDPRYKELHMDPIFTDNPLHPIGIQQCLNHQKYINEIDFEIVFVSPLQRTLQTCIYLFASHPNRENIKFVLMPELYECLCSSGCFGPSTLTTIKDDMSKLAKDHGIQLDFTEVEKLGRYWQIKILEDQNLSKTILDEINASVDHEKESTYTNIVYSAMEKASSFFLETWKMLFMRSRTVIQKLQEQEKVSSKDANKKIGVVAHGFLIKCLTASKIEENGRIEEGIVMNNCQLLPYSF